MSDDPATKAAAAALHALRLEGNYVRHEGDCPCCGIFARAAVEAARPIIEAEMVKRLVLKGFIRPDDGARLGYFWAADNGESELDDQVAITGQYPPTGDTVWPPADNGEPEAPCHCADPDIMVSPERDRSGLAELQAKARAERAACPIHGAADNGESE